MFRTFLSSKSSSDRSGTIPADHSAARKPGGMGSSLERLVKRYPDLGGAVCAIQKAYKLLVATYQGKGKLLICGNGGSAADCEHIVGELMKGFNLPRPIPAEIREKLVAQSPENGAFLSGRLQGALPAISLASQTALITAMANDVEAQLVFAQQVYGYGQPGDALLAISTSGASKNVINALEVARAMGISTLGLTGRGSRDFTRLCDVAICIPAEATAEIQERHIAVYHTLCAMLEQAFFA